MITVAWYFCVSSTRKASRGQLASHMAGRGFESQLGQADDLHKSILIAP